MAKISGINTNLRGQIGDYLFRKTKYGTIVSEAPSKRTTPVRTESQMYIRTQWVNLGAVYRQFNKTLKKAYEGLGNTMSVYNAFVQANINMVKVFCGDRRGTGDRPEAGRAGDIGPDGGGRAGGGHHRPQRGVGERRPADVVNLRFSSFAPRQCSSELGIALGLASVLRAADGGRGDGHAEGGDQRHEGVAGRDRHDAAVGYVRVAGVRKRCGGGAGGVSNSG